jgi:Fe-S cluster assembly protein SufD
MSAVAKFIPRYRAETSALGLIDWDRLSPAAAEWVNALRRRAQISVCETGLPTQKLERWKYTNLPAKLKKMELSYQGADITLSGMKDYAEIFSKGMLHFPQWAQDMVERDAPSVEKYGDMMLWSLAGAYLKDGFTLDVPANTKTGMPLNVSLSGHDGAYFVPRQVIRIDEGAEFTLIETQSGQGAYWGNIVTQVEIAKGAKFKHYRFQQNSEAALMTQNTHIVLGEGAEYEAFTITTGANLSRNQIHVDMMGANAVCRLNGANMIDGSKLADTTITVDHCAPHCNSYQDYRTVVADKAVSVFQGKVHVHQIAQKTDGYQMAKSLLLSAQATVNTKPELEIYADDVKCSHGATTGRLDEEALFYMRSRGIPEAQAKNLLIESFVNEVIEGISCDDVREQSIQIISDWLSGQS